MCIFYHQKVTFWRPFCEKRNNSFLEGSIISDFFVLRLSKYNFFLFSPIVSYISFAEFFNFSCLFDFHFLKTSLKVAISWSLHNNIVEFFSHERGFICTKVFFSDRCMFIEDAKDWLLNLSQDWHFRNCSWMGSGGQKSAPTLRSVTHILQLWNLTQLYLT